MYSLGWKHLRSESSLALVTCSKWGWWVRKIERYWTLIPSSLISRAMHIAQPWHCLISTNLRAILNLFLLQVRFFFVFFLPHGSSSYCISISAYGNRSTGIDMTAWQCFFGLWRLSLCSVETDEKSRWCKTWNEKKGRVGYPIYNFSSSVKCTICRTWFPGLFWNDDDGKAMIFKMTNTVIAADTHLIPSLVPKIERQRVILETELVFLFLLFS